MERETAPQEGSRRPPTLGSARPAVDPEAREEGVTGKVVLREIWEMAPALSPGQLVHLMEIGRAHV